MPMTTQNQRTRDWGKGLAQGHTANYLKSGIKSHPHSSQLGLFSSRPLEKDLSVDYVGPVRSGPLQSDDQKAIYSLDENVQIMESTISFSALEGYYE